MSTSRSKTPKSRPPVDAVTYEKLALNAFRACEQRAEQFDKLARLAASICRSPAITVEERHAQRTVLELLVDTVESYKQMNGCDLELFKLIALEAKGVEQIPMTGNDAISILDDALGSASTVAATH